MESALLTEASFASGPWLLRLITGQGAESKSLLSVQPQWGHITISKVQRASQKREQKECKRQRKESGMCGMLSLGRTWLCPHELSAAVLTCAEVHDTEPINIQSQGGKGFLSPQCSLRTCRQLMAAEEQALPSVMKTLESCLCSYK